MVFILNIIFSYLYGRLSYLLNDNRFKSFLIRYVKFKKVV